MKADLQTSLLLAVIALALFAIALNPWVQPIILQEQGFQSASLERLARTITEVADGVCRNPSIC